MLARQDGLFLFDLKIDVGAIPPTISQEILDRDVMDVAYITSMVAKLRLGHIHDVHRPSRLRERRWWSTWTWFFYPPQDITPSLVLISDPVRLDETRARALFSKGGFENSDLRNLPCVPSRTARPGEKARNAVTTLRRRYARVFDGMSGVLSGHRTHQAAWERSHARRWGAIWGLVAALSVYSLLRHRAPWDWREAPAAFGDVSFWFGLTLAPCAGYFYYYFSQLRKWDTPRIQLLRQATTYYQYVNPVNAVVARVMRGGRHRVEVENFDHIIEVLRTKTEGEVHRAASHQTWLTFFLAFAGIVFAGLAIHSGAGENSASPSPPGHDQPPAQQLEKTIRTDELPAEAVPSP